jgi:hypothetical protein
MKEKILAFVKLMNAENFIIVERAPSGKLHVIIDDYESSRKLDYINYVYWTCFNYLLTISKSHSGRTFFFDNDLIYLVRSSDLME